MHLFRSPARLGIVLAAALPFASSLPAQQPIRCGTPPRDLAHAPDGPTDCAYSSTNPLSTYAPSYVFRIPVVFHIIKNTSGSGNVTTAAVQSQVAILNEDFRAKPNTNGAAGVDTRIEFYLATVDPAGNPTTGITTDTNNTWFNDAGQYWNTLAWDTNRYLNIYSNGAGGYLGYVPNIPQGGGLVGTKADRVVVLWSTIGRNGPYGPPYNQGRTVTHEVGHWCGLWHTFDNGCGSATSCYTTGDMICDTQQEQSPHFGCPTTAATCGNPDPIRNYLNYTDDLCMNNFTQEQARRMRCTLLNWRPAAWSQCAAAAVATRNVAPNPQSYTATPPVLGQPFVATINLATTGHSQGALLGSTKSLTLPIAGYNLLVDLGTPPTFAIAATGSPSATVQFTIPNDATLCGALLYTQAAHAGTVPGFALANAQDLTVGL